MAEQQNLLDLLIEAGLVDIVEAAMALDAAQFQALLDRLGNDGGGAQRTPVFSSGNGDEWMDWRETFEATANARGWNEDRRKVCIASAIQGFARRCVSHINTGAIAERAAIPAAPGFAGLPAQAARPALTSAQILDAYGEKFVTSAHTVYARTMFKTANQKQDESLVVWHTRITNLYRRTAAHVDTESTVELIERFTEGLSNVNLQQKVMEAQPTTMAEALKAAVDHAAVLSVLKKRTEGQHRRQPPSLMSMDSPSNFSGSIRCYNCSGIGHISRNCPQPRRAASAGHSRPPFRGSNYGNRGGGNRPQPSWSNAATAGSIPSQPAFRGGFSNYRGFRGGGRGRGSGSFRSRSINGLGNGEWENETGGESGPAVTNETGPTGN